MAFLAWMEVNAEDLKSLEGHISVDISFPSLVMACV